jgi:zinc transport system substrate-binding protein
MALSRRSLRRVIALQNIGCYSIRAALQSIVASRAAQSGTGAALRGGGDDRLATQYKLITSAVSAAAMACFLLAAAGDRHAEAASADIKVVATIKPVHALVAGVMDGVAVPELLVAGSASPHTFSLKPSGARALNDAGVFFRVSAAVEPFTVKITAALPASVRVSTLADAPGVHHLPARRGATFEPHDDHGHNHDGHDHADDLRAGSDGRVWLDPGNAKKIVSEIARVLSERYPEHAERFAANARSVIDRIETLDGELQAALAPIRDRPYVVFHDAYQYFERRYELSPAGAITIGPDVQPGAKRLAELRRKITDLKVTCAFAEPQYSSKVVQAVTDGTPVRFGTLDPEGALVDPGPEAYAILMRNLASSLRDCLSQRS